MNAVFTSTRFSAAAFGPSWQKSDQSICRIIIGPHFPEAVQKVCKFYTELNNTWISAHFSKTYSNWKICALGGKLIKPLSGVGH